MLENKVNEDQVNENEDLEGQDDLAGTPDEDNRGQDTDGSSDGTNDHNPDETVSDEDSSETFPRSYVEKLRKSEAKYRERAKRADALAEQLHTALVKLDGRLADPEDLEFNEDHLEDPDALAEAISDLVARKPGLRAQQLGGDVGAGARGSKPKPPADLISLIRGL